MAWRRSAIERKSANAQGETVIQVSGAKPNKKMSRNLDLALRRKAKAAQTHRDAQLLDLHRLACAHLQVATPDAAQSLRDKARTQVDRWERGNLCSSRYIVAWRKILTMSAKELQAAVLRADAEGLALRQNTPFGFLVRTGSPPSPPPRP